VAAALLLGLPAALCAAAPPELRLESRLEEGWISVAARIVPGPDAEAQREAVLDAIGRGLRSEIELTFRLYEPSRGMAALLGDHLLREIRVARTMRWEPFDLVYVLDEEADGIAQQPLTAADPRDLLDAFFAVEWSRLLPAPSPMPPAAYVTARYRLSPVRIDGPLNLVALLFDVGTRSSAWTRSEALGGTP
jgi:hypothetical protein